MDRRYFLEGCLGLSVGALTPKSVWARGPEFSGSLEKWIFESARKIGKGRSLRMLLPEGCEGNIKPVKELFERETGIDISSRSVPVDDINAVMLVEQAAGRVSFDIALPATFGIPDLAEAKVIRPLDEYAKRFEPEKFSESALYTLGDFYRGSLYGYQTDGDTYVLFFLKSLLQDKKEKEAFENRFGYPLALPRTWGQLDDMLEFFHRPKDGRYGGALFRTPNYIVWEWWVRFHSKGWYPFADDLTPLINNDAGVEALEELVRASDFLYPGAGMNGLFDNWKAFSAGNTFCNIGWGGTQKFLNSSPVSGDLEFAMTPGLEVPGETLPVPYFNWGWNYTISSASPHPELAYLFALFAVSPGGSLLAVREQSGYFDPFRVEHYSDSEVEKSYSASFLETHQASMRRSIPDLYLKGQGDYFDVLREYLMKVSAKRMKAKDALDSVAKAWDLLAVKNGKAIQLDQWRFLKSQYPKELRMHLKS